MPTYPADAVCRKLGINRDELNAMYTNVSVRGWTGTRVADDIRQRFGIDDPQEPLGAALAAKGVLTEPEGRYLDDAD